MYVNPQMTKQESLEYVLNVLCNIADRNICVFLPEKPEDQIQHLKKEILITLDKIQ